MQLKKRIVVAAFLSLLSVVGNSHGLTTFDWHTSTSGKSERTSSVDTATHLIAINFPEVNFTDPVKIYTQSAYSYTIIDRFIELLKAIPAKDSVYMSMFLFSHKEAINAIKEADERGVVINLLIDSSRDESIKQNQLAYQTFSQLKNGVYRTVANDITFGKDNAKGIDHNKFAIFSSIVRKADTVHDVIFQTSNNFTNTQCSYFQDNIILVDSGLYQCYRSVWKEIYNHAKSSMNEVSFKEYDHPEKGIHGYFFPKIKYGKYFGTDPVEEILDQVTDPKKDTIRILMATWTPSRTNILDKLASLLGRGARVEIITSADGSSGMVPALLQLMQKGAFVRLFQVPDTGRLKKNVHSKYLLINGYINHVPGTIVATGSENYTSPALKTNNETLLTFRNSSFFNKYVENFDRIKNL